MQTFRLNLIFNENLIDFEPIPSLLFDSSMILDTGEVDALFKLFDPSYQFVSSNPSTVPRTKLDYMDPVSNLGTMVLVYLNVVKVTNLNNPDHPCTISQDFQWTQCVRGFINEATNHKLGSFFGCESNPISRNVRCQLVN